jgi:circadian clock protein KaiB
MRRRSTRAELEAVLSKPATARYVLRLYVVGMTPKSTRAITNIKAICEEHLRGRYDLEVIDVYQQPTLARGEQILAVPALVKKLPLPLRTLVGDLSNTERVLLGLDLRRSK